MDPGDANANLLASMGERHVAGVAEALKNGADANFKGSTGGQPLHSAAYDKDSDVVLKIIDHLLAHGAEIDTKDDDGFTPLMVAALNGNKNIVKKLLDNYAKVGLTRLNTGETALHLAMNKNSFDTATELLDAGADPNAKTSDTGSTPLHLAAEFGNALSAEAIVRHCTFNSLQLKDQDKSGKTASQVATSNGHQELAIRLDLLGIPQTSAGKKIISAIISSNEQELEDALEEGDGTSLNKQTPRGNYPLHEAAARGSGRIVQLLLRKGAKVDITDTEGYSPLMVASLNGHTKVVEELLAYNADPNRSNYEDAATPLHMAMVYDSSSIVKALLDKGADINAKMTDESTPLHLAVKYRATLSMQELLKDPICHKDTKNSNGHTPAGLAKMLENTPALRLLTDNDKVDVSRGQNENRVVNQTHVPRTKVTYGQPRYPDDRIYKNTSTPRGLVLIINNSFKDTDGFRHGSERDIINLESLFREMGYEVYDTKKTCDLSKKKTLKVLTEFSQDSKLGEVDSSFVFMLSHGENGKFLANDYEPVEEYEVYDIFAESKCPLLKDKPKIFAFNFCRGEALETRTAKHHKIDSDAKDLGTDAQKIGYTNINGSEEPKDQPTEPNSRQVEAPKDVMSIFASSERIKALRAAEYGTLFIHFLCQMFGQYAHNYNISELVTKISDQMEKEYFTTPEAKTFHFKTLYLNPIKPVESNGSYS